MGSQLNKAQEKAQKKKVIILAVMVLGTGATWSKTLFGKDDKPAAAAAPAAAATTSATGTPTASAAASLTSSIGSYEQAVQRMKLWPKALNRQVHLGTIEELTPINDLLSNKEEEIEKEKNTEELPGFLGAEILPPLEDESVDFDALRLRLTTTARLGKSTYAVISNERVKPGQTVEVQVDGKTVRYEVRAIGTRMVEIAFRGTTHILRIDLPDLQRRDQDGA